MDLKVLIDGLIMYFGLVVLLTFHEFGHAWMAWKCGDETARSLGRCSLNPIVHIDPIGTVLLPLMAIYLAMSGSGLAGFIIGWAKPVPVNSLNLRNPRMDDILVSMAGPWMNLMLAVVLMAAAKAALLAGYGQMADLCWISARTSLLLCFFNLIPVPPLDGSHLLRIAVGMSYETYRNLARFGFIVVIILLQIPMISGTLSKVTRISLKIIAEWFRVPLPF